MRFKIEYVKNKIKPGNWIGMNKKAAKELGVPFHHKGNVIEIYKTSRPIMRATEKHEEIEYSLMKQGFNYHKAHKFALKHELDKNSIKNILKAR